jgi:hypothetical protein
MDRYLPCLASVFLLGSFLSVPAQANLNTGHYVDLHPNQNEKQAMLDVAADPTTTGAIDVKQSLVVTMPGCTGSGTFELDFSLPPSYSGGRITATKLNGGGTYQCSWGTIIIRGIQPPQTATFTQSSPTEITVNSSFDAVGIYDRSPPVTAPQVAQHNLTETSGKVKYTVIPEKGRQHTYVTSLRTLVERYGKKR